MQKIHCFVVTAIINKVKRKRLAREVVHERKQRHADMREGVVHCHNDIDLNDGRKTAQRKQQPRQVDHPFILSRLKGKDDDPGTRVFGMQSSIDLRHVKSNQVVLDCERILVAFGRLLDDTAISVVRVDGIEMQSNARDLQAD